jgi:hypothetical protein
MCLLQQHLSHMQSEERPIVWTALLTQALARLAPQPPAGAYSLRRQPLVTAPAPQIA